MQRTWWEPWTRLQVRAGQQDLLYVLIVLLMSYICSEHEIIPSYVMASTNWKVILSRHHPLLEHGVVGGLTSSKSSPSLGHWYNLEARGPESSVERVSQTWKRRKRRTGILQQFISIYKEAKSTVLADTKDRTGLLKTLDTCLHASKPPGENIENILSGKIDPSVAIVYSVVKSEDNGTRFWKDLVKGIQGTIPWRWW